MARDDAQPTHSRRSMLGLVSATVTGLSVGVTDLQVDAGYVLKQGDRCFGLEPLSGSEPVETFYDWRKAATHYSSAGTVDLQRPETSILFLYEGPNGVSLVMVHGKYDGTAPAGVVSFAFDGLPSDGGWAVQDDLYDGPSNVDQWNRSGSAATVDWRWSPGRTDGGAFTAIGRDPDLELTVRPNFNEQAALWPDHDGGRMTSWQALSGSLSDPDRQELAMDEPITIARGVCGELSLGSETPSPGGSSPSEEESSDRPGRREGQDGDGNPGGGNGGEDDEVPGRGDEQGRGPPEDRGPAGDGSDDDEDENLELFGDDDEDDDGLLGGDADDDDDDEERDDADDDGDPGDADDDDERDEDDDSEDDD